jgi:transcriptional regulator with XRE-family HTH domain
MLAEHLKHRTKTEQNLEFYPCPLDLHLGKIGGKIETRNEGTLMSQPDLNTKNEELGRLLKRHRLAAGLSLEVLGRATGMESSTVHRIETGRIAAPSPQYLQRLASALGTEVEDYFALAGYFTPHGLPGLRPYLRAKYDLTDAVAGEVEDYVSWLQSRHGDDDQSEDNN